MSVFDETNVDSARNLLVECENSLLEKAESFDIHGKRDQLVDLISKATRADFWSDRKSAEGIQSEIKSTRKIIEQYESEGRCISDARAMIDLAVEENDRSFLQTAFSWLDEVNSRLSYFPSSRSSVLSRLEQIANKLDLLRRADPNCLLHGTNSHQYSMSPPLSELEGHATELSLGSLPAEYMAFLINVGTGPAGPGYGLYSFDKLGRDTLFAPDTPFDDVGCIAISHVGCGAESLLIVEGHHTSRVCNSESLGEDLSDSTAPTFLDWYEGWLDYGLEKA